MTLKKTLYAVFMLLGSYCGLVGEVQVYDYYLSANWNLGWHSESEDNELKKKGMDHRHFGAFIAVGKLFNCFRAELLWGFIQTEHKLVRNNIPGTRTSLDVYNVLVNGFYDYCINARMEAYFGLGGGLTFLEYFSNEKDDGSPYAALLDGEREERTAVGLQVMGGLAHNIADNVQVTIGYRFFFLPHYVDYHSHNLDIGLRVKL